VTLVLRRLGPGNWSPVHIDWLQVLLDLRTLGFALPVVAEHTGIPRETLRDWYERNTQPRHAPGEVLIRFWLNVTGRDRAELPLMPR
jgi:hypothetical protein